VHVVLVLYFVPGGPAFFAGADAIDFFGVVIFDDEIDELTRV
jgi:hypothetical protein